MESLTLEKVPALVGVLLDKVELLERILKAVLWCSIKAGSMSTLKTNQ